MPLNLPNRQANPVSLEAYEAPCVLRQEGGLWIPFKNTGSTSYLAGEPIVMFGRTCIVQRTILPGKMGTLIADWVVDAILDPAHSGNINQGDLIYWDTTKDAIRPVAGGDPVSGIGAASATQPGAGNGFLLGRAVIVNEDDYAAVTGSKRVRVVSLPGDPVTY
ncbi:MAG: hypothetical protein KatS3mg087_1373 [Patescibacteria group bacterium]|nr:MAG: hypothetical protein KatS3mg087_1373 [Patescibacteria group bacterium]